MQVSLSIENLPIQERMALVRQVWNSIVADAQKGSSENHFNKQELQQLLNELPDMPSHSNEPTARQAQFLAWRAKHEQDLQSLDEEWDDDWANVRDKTDVGREFNWSE